MWQAIKSRVGNMPGIRRAYRGIAGCGRHWRRRNMSVEEIFTDVFHQNLWKSRESASGKGSELEQTGRFAVELPALLRELRVATLLDIPCGDFHWMRTVDLEGVRYTGADIVGELIERNQRYAKAGVRFQQLDLLGDRLPQVDLVLCRDCLVHFSFDHVRQALRNLRASGSTYLLTTTFPHVVNNHDIRTGDWRALNLEAAPLHFPPPLRLLVEGCTEHASYTDKSLGLWRLADL
jgi:hypothetical protein